MLEEWEDKEKIIKGQCYPKKETVESRGESDVTSEWESLFEGFLQRAEAFRGTQ